MNETTQAPMTVTLELSVLERIMAIGVWKGEDGLGGALMRMCYMRDALEAAINGDTELLEAFEQRLNK